MKKLISLMIAVMMLIVPVLSFAESAATDTTVQIYVNQDVLAAFAGEDAAFYATIAQMLALKLHSQENQFRAALSMEDFSIADLIFEMAEKGLIIGSSLIGDNAILVSYEDLNELLSSMSASAGTSNNNALNNLNLDHTLAVIQEVVTMDVQPVKSWDGTSDPATSLLAIKVSPDAFLKIIDAVFADIQTNGAAEQLLAMSHENRDYDTVVAEAKSQISAIMPADGDFLTIRVGTNDKNEPVYVSAILAFIDNVISDVNIKEITNDAGETDYDLEYTYEKAERKLIADAFRSSSNSQMDWSCDLVLTTAGETVSAYYGLDISVADNAVEVIFYLGSQDEESEKPDISMMASLVIDGAKNDGSFEFAISMADENDFSNLLTLKGGSYEKDGSNVYGVGLNLAGFEDEVASIAITSVPGETLASIANKTLINFKDLNEETLSSLGELATNNLMGLFGSMMGLSL